MTDEALSALAEAATPGPWRVEHNGAGEYYLLAQQGPMTVSPAEAHGASDAAFIAAARDAVPSLLARVAKAEERVKELGGLLREMLNALDAEAKLVSRAERMAEDQDAYSENELSAANDAACNALVESMSVFARAVLEKG